MKPIFHPEAAEEFYAAVRQYAEICASETKNSRKMIGGSTIL